MFTMLQKKNGARRLRRKTMSRQLQAERLEDRRLLAFADFELSSLLPSNGAGLGETDTSTILWQGEQRAVNPGHWIVAMDGLPVTPSLQLTAGARALQQRASGPALKALGSLGGRGSLLIETAPNVSFADVKTSLSSLPGFRYVEPDFLISLNTTTPNDPSFPSLYGLNNTGQTGGTLDADIDASEAWDLTIGSRSIVVGVIDTGVDYTHPDLAANIWTNPGEVAGDGIDNDGNGYIDDVHGYDFINNDGDPMDDYGHGTHVSGTIGAIGNNTVGVAGVNWQVQIMGLKFLGSNGSGPTSAAVSALNYATMMRNNYGVNIRLTNNSWGGGAFSQSMSDAITASGNAGMLFIASAGNNASDNDATPSYPASYNLPNMIAVAATDQNDALASFSNYGATSVDLAAPGVSILSTYPGNTYSSMSGTSMAAPHVSGVAALAWSYAPGATYQQVRDAMFDGVDPLSGLNGHTVTGGRLNARNTLDRLPSDAGDTLATARVTRMAAPAPGDHFILPSARIGDGTFGNKDVDLYQISGTAGSTFTALTSQPSSGAAMNTVLRLFSSAGVQVAANDDFNGGLYSRLDYTFPAAGTFYVGVSGAGNANYNPNTGGSGAVGSTGDYRLDISLDIGDTLGTAVPTGLILGGSFAQPNTPLGDGAFGNRDVDVYQFTAPAGSTLTAVTDLPTGGTAMDTILRLFDSSGSEMAVNDNFTGLYSRLDYTFPMTGTYFIGVSGAGNANYYPTSGGSGVTGSTGDYRLDLSLDIGDTLETATVTGLAGTGSFAVASTRIGDGPFDSSDVDLYQFSAAANSVLVAATSQPAGGTALDTFLRLFDSVGTPLAAENNSPLYSRLHYVFPADGTFYVGVSGAGNASYNPIRGDDRAPGSTGDYRLDLTVTPLSAAEFELSTLLAANADGSQGFAVSGIVNQGYLGGPSKYQPVGDINGDHIDDFLLTAPFGGVNQPVSGQAYLIFGRPGGFPAELDLHLLDGTTGYVINGVQTGDQLGSEGGGAGDLNGDSFPDLVLGAPYADRNNLTNAGQTYVLFGGSANLAALDSADGAQDGRINLAALDGTNGFTINGIAANSYGGPSLGAAGDVNHDGVDDLVIGAIGIGVDYVVFGRKGAAFPAVLELSSLDGANGFSIPQLAAGDYLGYAVTGVGDVNADGIADILLGARFADPAGRSSAGQAYVIFGRPSFPAVFSLASLDGNTGFTINGSADGDLLGFTADRAGDVNGDGVSDLLISAPWVTGPAGADAGAAYVVFGKRTPFDSTLEISSLNGSNGVALNGRAAGTLVGYRLSGVGDINRDGYDDVLVGAPYADPNNLANAGQSYLVYGGPSFGPSFDLASLLAADGGDGSAGFALNGFAAGDNAGSVARLGDINADGFPDLRVGATYADPNGLTDAGQAYIVYGKPSPPRIRVMPATGLTTTESGGAAIFSVLLTTQPTADVTIPVSSSDTTEGTIPVSSLTFTHDNWNVPQTVTVTGVNDAYADSDVAYTILLGAASSSDPTYNGLDPASVSVTNVDNDIFTATFAKTENKRIPDRGTYTSSLAVAPTGRILDLDVRVNITHGWDEDLDVFLIAPDGTRTELFTDVGGTGVNFTNTVLDDEAVTPISSGSAPFTGSYRPEGNLTLLEGKNLAGTWKLEVTDDQRLITGQLVDWSIAARYTSATVSGPQAVVAPTSGLVTTEAGGTASFTVKLDTAPTASVTIPVSSSDTSEGTVSTSSLMFTTSNWNVAQTVTVSGMDDATVDGNIAYTIAIGPATSADPDFNGLNPTDVSVTNTDNEIPPTKFYVVNDATQNVTYEYSTSGGLVESYSLNSGNTAPRGAASTTEGNRTWVVDANRKVYVYNTSGGLIGSWTAGTLASTATVEGIATNGTDIWIVDAKSDKVFKYLGAATRITGSQDAASSFSLNSGNTSPKDIVTDGASLWVVNDSSTDKVFKYTVAGSLAGSWTISSGGGSPTGITLDPANVSHLWIVDSATDRVYQYDGAASLTSGSQAASTTFALAAGNTNPQGIADPPVPSSVLATETRVLAASVSPASAFDATDEALAGLYDSPLTKASSAFGVQEDSLCLDTGRFRASLGLEGDTRGLGLFASPLANRIAENDGWRSTTLESNHHGQAALDDLFAEWDTDPLEMLSSPAVGV